MKVLLAALCAAGVLAAAAPTELVHRDVYLMGTRARLAVYAVDRGHGFATLERALTILEGTERELTTWNDDSEISRLNRTPVGKDWRANDELCRLFDELYEWNRRTRGTFDPATSMDRQGGLTRIGFDRASCTLTRRADVAIDVGGFGKGEALDRVATALPNVPWMIDLGGQVSVGAANPTDGFWTIDVAHPADRERSVMQVRLTSGSLSTSGISERGPHIRDPRSGQPAVFGGSVVVWHERGLIADILSTALFVMGPEEGLRWAEAQGFAACFLIPHAGRLESRMTAAFTKLIASKPSR